MIEKEYLNPFYEELEKLIGLEHTEVFYHHYQGMKLNVPKRLYSPEKVQNCLQQCLEKDGSISKKEKENLSKKFDYSERQLERFIGNAKQMKKI